MKILFIGLLIAFNTNYSLLAQSPDIEWQRSIGGSDDDYTSSIKETSDGGFILASSSKSNDGDVIGNHGGYDYWISKLDASGNIIWQRSFGGSGDDIATSIQQTSEGGYIVSGRSNSNDGDVTGNNGQTDFWIVKLDSAGSISWQKALGGSNEDYANCIQQTEDGGYIVAGDTYSDDGDVSGLHGWVDFWVVKLDAYGNISWQKAFGGTDFEVAESIQQTTDNGYIVAGSSSSSDGDVTVNNGQFDCWVVKLDPIGNLLWQKSLGGNYDDVARSIQQTTDGGYVAAGLYTSSNGLWDCWIIKLDSIGTLSWDNVIGGGNIDRAISIQQTIDAGYILAGHTESIDGDVTGNHGGNDSWVVKLDASGNITWQKALGGSDDDVANSVIQTASGGFVVVGLSKSTDGDLSENHGGNDSWVVKLEPNADMQDMVKITLSIYPNPTPGKLIISCIDEVIGKPYYISDLSGNIVSQGIIKSVKTELDISILERGIYGIYMANMITTKFVKL